MDGHCGDSETGGKDIMTPQTTRLSSTDSDPKRNENRGVVRIPTITPLVRFIKGTHTTAAGDSFPIEFIEMDQDTPVLKATNGTSPIYEDELEVELTAWRQEARRALCEFEEELEDE